MSDFKVFQYLDATLVQQESRDPRPSQVPAIWPSKASAERLNKDAFKIVGSCMRENYCRMTGRPVSNQIDAKGAWKWVTGRAMEGIVTDLAEGSKGLLVANGVRHYVRDLYMPFELDLVVINPYNGQPWIGECKTYDGYYAEKEIEKLGMPKLENLLQVCLYLVEVPTGAKLREIIVNSQAERTRLDGLKGSHRNRIEVVQENLDKMSDGPLGGAKLMYVSRGEVNRTEFDITIVQDFDGSHYPAVNGKMYKIFTIESIYSRFHELQKYWFEARKEAVSRLERRGVTAPATLKLVLAPGEGDNRDVARDITDEQKKAETDYLDQLTREVWTLPDEFLPPAEYEWAYTAEKIERMNNQGLLTKKAYDGWKKNKGKVGDWQCLYCAYKSYCVPKQNPNWTYMVYDVNQIQEGL